MQKYYTFKQAHYLERNSLPYWKSQLFDLAKNYSPGDYLNITVITSCDTDDTRSLEEAAMTCKSLEDKDYRLTVLQQPGIYCPIFIVELT